jgi:hypothetical protein
MFIRNTTLILLAVASVFFPRLLESSLGLPSVINFAHFVIVPFTCGVVLLTSRIREIRSINASKGILIGLAIFLAVIFASALLNSAGVINALLTFLIFCEPFMLLLAITALPFSRAQLRWFQAWIERFFYIHLISAYVQYVTKVIPTGNPDDMQGVFFHSGAGQVVGGGVTFSYALYYLTLAHRPIWLRILILLLSLGQILLADVKQMTLIFFIAAVVHLAFNINKPGKTIFYLTSGIVLFLAFMWAVENVEAFQPYTVWMSPEIYGPNGSATYTKLCGIRTVLEHYTSPLNNWLGIGPGHAIDRIGGWMVRDYAHLLRPLGVTRMGAGQYEIVPNLVWDNCIDGTFLGRTGSTLFSPFFTWAGIWGSLGWIGIASYLCLWIVVLWHFGKDEMARFLVLTVLVFGFALTQLEEPGYMLFVISLIGIRWQESRVAEEERIERHQSWALLANVDDSASSYTLDFDD